MQTRPSFINELDWNLLIKKYKSERKLSRIIEKIKNDYPVQYLIGDVEFLRSKILVDERVLIPRFETELLVDKLIKYIEKYELSKADMIDLCTGSGCIAISLKKHFRSSNVSAVDKSFNALALARKNAKLNNTVIKFLRKDILKDLKFKKKFSILISNPPYVRRDDYVTPNTMYEPDMALYPGEDDIIFYKKILDAAKDMLYKTNIIVFEIGSEQSERICKYASKIYPDSHIVVEQDYSGLDRFIFIFNNCE